MKCKQKLCQRTRNLCSSGNCNVCDDAINEITKKFEAKKKKSNFDKVQLDMELMIDTHKKLANGSKVESKVVNELLIAGVLNILSQSEAFEDLEAQVKTLTNEDRTNKAKIESLENWVMKQDDAIKKLDEKLTRLDENGVFVKESNEMETIKKKLISVEIDISSMKMQTRREKEGAGVNRTKKNYIKCKKCSKQFEKNSDFEKHMTEEHEQEKKFACQRCGKKFLLEWRMEKHMNMHKGDTKHCHYFNNHKSCPFDDIGCKFLHESSGKCRFDICLNKLCQFEHHEDVELEIDNEDHDETFRPNENQCHICRQQLQSKDDLYYHVEAAHEEYFQGMLEVTASRSNFPL